MTEAEGELVENAFFFGTRIEAYLRDTAKAQKGDGAAMLRTLIEIADGETILTDSDADLNASLKAQLPVLSDEMRSVWLEFTAGRHAEDKAQAQILVELFHARAVLAEFQSLQKRNS